MESAVSFAPLRPADFVNFAGRGKACFSRGGAGQPVFPRGGATIPASVARIAALFVFKTPFKSKSNVRILAMAQDRGEVS